MKLSLYLGDPSTSLSSCLFRDAIILQGEVSLLQEPLNKERSKLTMRSSFTVMDQSLKLPLLESKLSIKLLIMVRQEIMLVS